MARPKGASVRLFTYSIPAQSEAMTGFPMLLPTPGATAEFWGIVQSNGSDVHVYDADWNELSYELVAIDTSAKTMQLWTKATLSATVATVLYYGCTGVAASNTPTAVWTGYDAVYHLSNANDSTANARNLTVANGSYSAGKIGNALSIDASTTAYHASTGNFEYNQAFSGAAWVKRPGGSANPCSIIGKFTEATYRGWWLYLTANNNTIAIIIGNSVSPVYIIRKETVATITDTNWHHIAFTYSGNGLGSGVSIYIDGAIATSNVTNDTLGGRTIVGAQQFGIGVVSTGSYRATNHLIDQVHSVMANRSAAWIGAQYGNQNNPSTWGTLGAEFKVSSARSGMQIQIQLGNN